MACCKIRAVAPSHSSRQRTICTCSFGGLLKETQQAAKKSLEPALCSWLAQEGLSRQKVEVANFKEQGRGLRATTRIRNGEQLLRIPESVLLTPEAAVRCSKLGEALQQAGLPAWSVLAAALAEARFADRDLHWKSYAQALPSGSGCVLEWLPEEVELLRGSSMHLAAQDILKAADTSEKELQALIIKAEADGVMQQGTLTSKRLRWAFGMLLSRLVRLPSWENAEALCPWADMINHDCRATTHLEFDTATRTVCLQSDRSYKSGEQVMASYGQKTSGQLLLSYGFAPTATENPHDACLLRLAVAHDDPLGGAKAAALRQHGLRIAQEYPLRMGALPQGVLAYAAFVDAEPSDGGEAFELADWLFGKGLYPKLDGVDTELLGVEVLQEECRRALNNYPESMAANQKTIEELKQFPTGHDTASMTSQNRKALITGVKLQEQKILNRAIFVLQQRRKELS